MKKHQFLFTILMAVVMMAISPQKVWALGGSGTSGSPYTIANAADLVAFANKVNGSEQGAYAKLTADITLTSAWTAMGTSSKPYTGTFDGNGKTISGLKLTATAANAGLFGYVNGATIKNFSLAGSVSSNSDNVGSVVGHSKGNTQILDVVSSVNITMSANKSHLGGIVGYLCDATGDTPVIKGCTYSGTMNVAGSTDSNGGIVGYGLKNANISITNCFFSGTIKTTGSNARVGGILGYADDDGSNFVALSNCFVSGSFTTGSGTDDVGAIAGMPRGNTYKVIKNNNCLSGIATHILGNNFERDGKCDASNKAITISVTAGSNGTVSQTYVNPTTSAATQLQVVATPNAHYHLNKWSDNGAQTHNVSLTDKVSLKASFAIDQHTISVATNNANYGTVSGGGTFDYNTKQTITATPKTHYHFVKWDDGDTNASRTITVTGDKTYTATFAPNQYTISVKTNDSNMGTVSGGGTFDYNSTKTITATPKTGYHFVQWSDNNTDATRTITVTGAATYTATFAPNPYTITVNVASGQSSMGTVSGGGTYNYGTQQTITATPEAHYHFVQWSDGNTDASRQITVNGNANYTATFAIDQHTITVQANNSNYGTVSGSGTYNYGTQQTITATPNAGYYFTGWSDGDTDNLRTITVSGEATYTATFGKPKAVLDGSTLTFYCDAEVHSGRQYDLNTGENYPAWADRNDYITSIVFDESFQYARPTSCYYWFLNCTNLTSITGWEYLNTSEVTTMNNMFNHCSKLSSLDLSHFNTEEVTDMRLMFNGCRNLTSLDLSSFNVMNVTIMDNIFSSCSSLRSITFGNNFHTDRVEEMNSMFSYCSSLQSLDLSSFNTESVTDIGSMFYGCSSLTSLDLSNFNTEKVNRIQLVFYGCSNLQSLTIGNLDMQKVTNAVNMFGGCPALNTLTMKSIPFLADGTFNTQFSGDGKTVNVILDDNSEIYTDGTNYLPAATSATFNREIEADGGMYSFFVPFDIPAGQAAELGKFYQYSGHDPEVRKVYFDDIAEVSDAVVKANTAYFFKPAKDITSFTVNNPSIPRNLTIRDPENPSVPGLYGTYREIEVPVGAYGYAMQGAESTFVRAGYGNVLRPFRAYLWLGSGAYMAKALAIRGQQKGDVNGDGKISLADLTLLIEILNGRATDTTGNADVDGKNGVTIDDLEILRNYILGLLNIEDLYPEYDGQTPTGFCINYDDEEQVPTISESIWDR